MLSSGSAYGLMLGQMGAILASLDTALQPRGTIFVPPTGKKIGAIFCISDCLMQGGTTPSTLANGVDKAFVVNGSDMTTAMDFQDIILPKGTTIYGLFDQVQIDTGDAILYFV